MILNYYLHGSSCWEEQPPDAGELSIRPFLGSAEGGREGAFPGKVADVFPGGGQTLTPTA